jgi:hypothetical protein
MRPIDERLFDIRVLAKEIKRKLQILNEQLTPAALELRKKLWGDEKTAIVATVAHQNLSIPSVYLVGWERFRRIVEMLNIEKAVWLVVNDENTVRNESSGKGGGNVLEFGPFGRFKSPIELKEKEDNLYHKIYGIILRMFRKEIRKDCFSRSTCRCIAETLLGRMKGVAQLDYGSIEVFLGRTKRIKHIYLLDLLRGLNIDVQDWRRNRIEFHKKSMVIHYGNIYRDDLWDTPWFIPDRVNSQTVLYWSWKNRKLDVTTMHLLYLSLPEYVKAIKERSMKLLSPSKVPIKQVEEIIYKYL